jgi:hypothetical protein
VRAEGGQRVLDRRHDGRQWRRGAGLADALDAEGIERTRRGQVSDAERRDLAGRRHDVLQERLHPRLALVVVRELLPERAADTLGHAAVQLSLDDARIDERPGVAGHRVVDDGDLPRLALHLDDGDVRAAGERGARRRKVVSGLEPRVHPVGQG